MAAEHGVLNATQDAQNAINTALTSANTNVPAATQTANAKLQDLLTQTQGTLAPSIASGAQGNTALQQYAASNPQFNFSLEDYLKSPALKFQQQQGQEAITNAATAQGLGASGNTMKALEQYGQGLASTYYDQAFNQAQSQFQTNQNATLANLQALINSGAVGNQQNLQAGQIFGVPQAQNNVNTAQYLAGLNLTGQTEAGREGMAGAQTAGNFAVGAGNARATGITGQGAALTRAAGSLGSLVFGGGDLGPASSLILGGNP